MRPDVERWLARRTSSSADWPPGLLRAAKHATTVSVVLPALDEQETVGAIVETVRGHLVDVPEPLVDEVVVMDSGSTDRTAEVAAAAGATVVHRDDVLPRIPAVPGKGEVLWRSLAATTGDVLVFVDADLRDFRADYVTGLLGPLLTDHSVALVKAVYDRPLRDGGTLLPAGGGRVTELVARPLLNLHWPELAGVVQPLAGEYAARRSLLELLPFPTGYGVELALLVDTLSVAGLDALAQVDLGVRHHRHQDDAGLGRMASEIMQAALTRLEQQGRLRRRDALNPTLSQFARADDGLVVTTHDVQALERPPMVSVPEYAAARDARAS
ncbi:MAG: glucosyl-3-phosphoglycerate synthase [Actinomycetia bacterium]|nr:glucosyl-3-phosphoglycerate synthase [Actinomycetes bacterium]